jgi:hypothetical protein
MNAVTREDLDGTIVHFNREVHGEFALTHTEDAAHVVIKADDIRGDVELFDRDVEEARFLRVPRS